MARLRWVLVGVDGLAALMAWTAVLFGPMTPLAVAGSIGAPLIGGVVGVTVMMALKHLYRRPITTAGVTELSGLGWVTLGSAGAAFWAARAGDTDLSVWRALASIPVTFVALVLGRGLFDAWLRARRTAGKYCTRLVIFGSGADAVDIVHVIDDHPELGFRLSGLVGDPGGEALLDRSTPWLGERGRLFEVVSAVGATAVMVTSDPSTPESRGMYLRALVDSGVEIYVSPALQRIAIDRLRPLPIAHEALLFIEPPRSSMGREMLSRAVDIALAPFLLLLALPFLIVAAIAIKVVDGGSVLFRQRRIGRDGVEFTCLKLRTMSLDAEARIDEVRHHNHRTGGPLFKAVDDPRVTKVGQFLRMTGLDELPQLVNVLRGDMALVGPRPALPSEVEEFDEELRQRHRVRPGLTGLWQLEAGENAGFGAYRSLDLFYVDNRTIGLDLVVMVLTAQLVVTRVLRFVIGRRTADIGAPAAAPAD